MYKIVLTIILCLFLQKLSSLRKFEIVIKNEANIGNLGPSNLHVVPLAILPFSLLNILCANGLHLDWRHGGLFNYNQLIIEPNLT